MCRTLLRIADVAACAFEEHCVQSPAVMLFVANDESSGVVGRAFSVQATKKELLLPIGLHSASAAKGFWCKSGWQANKQKNKFRPRRQFKRRGRFFVVLTAPYVCFVWCTSPFLRAHLLHIYDFCCYIYIKIRLKLKDFLFFAPYFRLTDFTF